MNPALFLVSFALLQAPLLIPALLVSYLHPALQTPASSATYCRAVLLSWTVYSLFTAVLYLLSPALAGAAILLWAGFFISQDVRYLTPRYSQARIRARRNERERLRQL